MHNVLTRTTSRRRSISSLPLAKHTRHSRAPPALLPSCPRRGASRGGGGGRPPSPPANSLPPRWGKVRACPALDVGMEVTPLTSPPSPHPSAPATLDPWTLPANFRLSTYSPVIPGLIGNLGAGPFRHSRANLQRHSRPRSGIQGLGGGPRLSGRKSPHPCQHLELFPIFSTKWSSFSLAALYIMLKRIPFSGTTQLRRCTLSHA